MNLTEEYKRQNKWRDWESYIERLTIDNNDTLIDFGCGIGVVTKMLANKASKVVGIDNNLELIKEAKRTNLAENIRYVYDNLSSLNYQNLPAGDGIWSSFVAAYFPDFAPILANWINILKPNGWLAIVEMSTLFDHEPLSLSTKEIFKDYTKRQRMNSMYDFEMGSRIKDIVTDHGLSIIHEEDKIDRELAFNGPAEPEIRKSWEYRFDRMVGFKEYLGDEKFYSIKNEFLDCLSDEHHTSNTIVKFIVAKK